MKSCRCGKEASRTYKKEPCCSECYRIYKLPEFLTARGVPPIYHNASLEDFSFKVPTNKSLFITGGVGCGKTHLMVALIRNDILTGTPSNPNPGRFSTVSDFLMEVKRTYANGSEFREEEILEKYSDVENLYFDDIGIEKITEWSFNALHLIVNHRYNNNLRTVFSSNMDLGLLAERIGERIVSRIIGMCQIIKLVGEDRRLK